MGRTAGAGEDLLQGTKTGSHRCSLPEAAGPAVMTLIALNMIRRRPDAAGVSRAGSGGSGPSGNLYLRTLPEPAAAQGQWRRAMGDFFGIVAAGPFFFVSAWVLMIFAGVVAADVGIRPFGYITSMIVTVAVWLTVAPAIGAIARTGRKR